MSRRGRRPASRPGSVTTWPGSSPRRSRTGKAEFLQLLVQATALALFYQWGSSVSRERSARVEAKLDVLLRRQGVDPDTLR